MTTDDSPPALPAGVAVQPRLRVASDPLRCPSLLLKLLPWRRVRERRGRLRGSADRRGSLPGPGDPGRGARLVGGGVVRPESGLRATAARAARSFGGRRAAWGGRCPSRIRSRRAKGSRRPAGFHSRRPRGGRCPSGFRDGAARGGDCPARFRNETARGGGRPAGFRDRVPRGDDRPPRRRSRRAVRRGRAGLGGDRFRLGGVGWVPWGEVRTRPGGRRRPRPHSFR
jgi:hypothetical protein